VASLSAPEMQTSVLGVSKASLAALLVACGEGAIPAQARYDALARFEELPARQSIKSGRYWKRDLANLDVSGLRVVSATDEPVRGESTDFVFRQTGGSLRISLPSELAARGVIVTSLADAASQHPALFATAFGRAMDTRDDKFASLALAMQNGGVFIAVPEGVALDDRLRLEYTAGATALFPYTLVYAASGSRFTVEERLETAAGDGSHGFLCGLAEIVADERANVTYVSTQFAQIEAEVLMTRRAAVAQDASVAFAIAELGAGLSVNRTRVVQAGRGSTSGVAAFFFPNGHQHVDLETEAIHIADSTTSETIVRSAGTDHGQGRYLGNIKITAGAHGADASLRDDALLLSQDAHVDSVPALEIAANDVKAFHGATVGAISEDEIFYAQSRGIARTDAERMIALGFFEPAIARFPTEALREELRAALAAKLVSPA
jgi:Fe-S cluster assembly protein SufD